MSSEDHQINVKPDPPNPARISKRVTVAAVALVAMIAGAIGYGIYKSGERNAAHRIAANPQNVKAPGSEASGQIINAIPLGSLSGVRPPGDAAPVPMDPHGKSATEVGQNALDVAKYGGGPQAAQQVGQQQNYQQQPYGAPIPPIETPAQKRRNMEARMDEEARMAPTGMKTGGTRFGESAANGTTATGAGVNPAVTGMLPASEMEAIRAMVGGAGAGENGLAGMTPQQIDELAHRLGYIKAGQQGTATGTESDALASTRMAQETPYTIRAGWEIPARLEQEMNSDLPGELKALVTENIYDTATGQFLLIPQGSRIVGSYDSHISFGQRAVRVSWNRIIFPDASALNIGTMEGLDSAGNGGLRGRVDHHYRQLIGAAVLTSVISAGFAISQQRNSSFLAVPSWQESASQGVGQGIQQVGNQIVSRSLNVQPTIQVPAGTRFTVRVSKDMMFAAAYTPEPAMSRQ